CARGQLSRRRRAGGPRLVSRRGRRPCPRQSADGLAAEDLRCGLPCVPREPSHRRGAALPARGCPAGAILARGACSRGCWDAAPRRLDGARARSARAAAAATASGRPLGLVRRPRREHLAGAPGRRRSALSPRARGPGMARRGRPGDASGRQGGGPAREPGRLRLAGRLLRGCTPWRSACGGARHVSGGRDPGKRGDRGGTAARAGGSRRIPRPRSRARLTMALGALRTTHDRIAQRLAALVPQDLVALAARFGIGATFWLSGRTKMEGVIAVTDGAIDLFREEFRLPLIDPVVAAHMAAWAETLFPMLLFLGLFTRL